MKKTFKLQNLGCANCAAKMEAAIKKLEGVSDASINFMASRLTIDAEEGAFEKILPDAQSICKKIESRCRIEI